MGRIVVGVDASPEALAAARWAHREAAAHGWHLQAVTAYHGCGTPDDQLEAMEPHHQAARDEAVHTLQAVLRQIDEPASDVPVEPLVLDGAPAAALIEQARGAELLVLGTPGHGTLAGLLLGSVSRQCVQDAPCPVVVVPPASQGSG